MMMRFRKKPTALTGAMVAITFSTGIIWAASNSIDIPPIGNKDAENSVLIGGFEEPALTDQNPSLYFPKGQVWKIWGHNGGGIQKNHSEWDADLAPEGVQTAFMHSGDVHMSRELRIEPGTYTISFYAARRRYGQENPNPVQILINGKECGTPITPVDTSFRRYYSPRFTVPAAAAYTIEIATRSREAVKGDTFLDKVELNFIPSELDKEALKNPFDALGSKARSWGS